MEAQGGFASGFQSIPRSDRLKIEILKFSGENPVPIRSFGLEPGVGVWRERQRRGASATIRIYCQLMHPSSFWLRRARVFF